jgi:hypothetical protein
MMKNKHARHKEEREISDSLCGWYCGILKYSLTVCRQAGAIFRLFELGNEQKVRIVLSPASE